MKRAAKKKIIQEHAIHKKDTGSPQVQIGIMSERIIQLRGHLEIHRKDEHSRRGLVKLVGQRRKLLNYLRTTNKEHYDNIVEKLKLRK